MNHVGTASRKADLRYDEANSILRNHAPCASQDFALPSLHVHLQDVDLGYIAGLAKAIHGIDLYRLSSGQSIAARPVRDEGAQFRVPTHQKRSRFHCSA